MFVINLSRYYLAPVVPEDSAQRSSNVVLLRLGFGSAVGEAVAIKPANIVDGVLHVRHCIDKRQDR